jgi:linoleoyl-CoA desaturase
VVEETCHEFGIRYAAHRSLFAAVASHFRWLVLMGRPESVKPAPVG